MSIIVMVCVVTFMHRCTDTGRAQDNLKRYGTTKHDEKLKWCVQCYPWGQVWVMGGSIQAWQRHHRPVRAVAAGAVEVNGGAVGAVAGQLLVRIRDRHFFIWFLKIGGGRTTGPPGHTDLTISAMTLMTPFSKIL